MEVVFQRTAMWKRFLSHHVRHGFRMMRQAVLTTSAPPAMGKMRQYTVKMAWSPS